MATAVRPIPKPSVAIGSGSSPSSPLPNWPESPLPQHETEPSSRIAHVKVYPEERATAVRPVSRLIVGVGVVSSNPPPLPNWPKLFAPQHEIEPSSRMAQV